MSEVLLGYISGAHGLKGWVKVHSDTEPREAILDVQPWMVGNERHAMRVVNGRVQGKRLVAQLEGVDDRDAAEQLTGQEIAVQREKLPELSRSQYYWDDLIGLSVFAQDGSELGQIREMLATGANDVMVVCGDRERLIPFVLGRYVRHVDLVERRLEVDWEADF